MTFEEFVSDVVTVVEAVGAAIMVVGGLWVMVVYVFAVVGSTSRADAYRQLRRNLGEVILLGLEVLIIGDIIRTIIVDPTVESALVLGLIVVIRIVLSFSLQLEIDGTWPWNRWRTETTREPPAR